MLRAATSQAEIKGRSLWLFMLVLAVTIAVDAVLLFGLLNRFGVEQLIVLSVSAALLAAGFLVTLAEFNRPAKQGLRPGVFGLFPRPKRSPIATYRIKARL